MGTSLWPILLVIAANTLYNLCAKSTPDGVAPFAALTVTYLIAAALSALLFLVSNHGASLSFELQKLNWSSFVFGISIVALEFGYIQIYRSGWDVSIGSLVANSGLACMLVLVGTQFYHEFLAPRQLLGMGLCAIGILLINR